MKVGQSIMNCQQRVHGREKKQVSSGLKDLGNEMVSDHLHGCQKCSHQGRVLANSNSSNELF